MNYKELDFDRVIDNAKIVHDLAVIDMQLITASLEN